MFKGNRYEKEQLFIEHNNIYFSNQVNFKKIPGSPIAYWVSKKAIEILENSNDMRSVGKLCLGMRTGDNERFLRLWFEVDYLKSCFNCNNWKDSVVCKKKWFPYNKGGEYRKWYGNSEYLVNWYNNGYEIKENTKRV